MKKNKICFFLFAVFLVLAASCSKNAKRELSDGVFSGEGAGRNGIIEVSVTVENGKVSKAEIINESETSDIGLPAEDVILKQFMAYGSTDAIDVVSGATITSNALLTALNMALDKSCGVAESQKVYEDTSADIIIIGAGGAGLSAAVEAASKGAEVIVLEKMGFVGGNTNSSTGGLNASQTRVQKKLGVEDTNEIFFADTMKGGKYKNDESLVRTLVDNSAAIVDWLQSDLIKADLSDLGKMGGASNKRAHRPAGGLAIGSHLVPKLYAAAKAQGAEIRLNSIVTDLIWEDGAVRGVEVKNNAGNYKIRSEAVIIATGGFGANPEMIAMYRPDLANFATTNVSGSTGDAFEWVKKLGGELVLMAEIQTHPTVVPGRGILITEAVRGNGAIMISQEGKRFINELETRDVTSKAVLSLPKKRAYIFFNEDVRKSLKAIESYVQSGLLTTGNSIEEIAKKLEIDSGVLKNTLDIYNNAKANGTDLLGRKDMAVSFEKGPYYAVEIEPAIHHTMGGIKINSKAEVIDKSGNPIPRLYAAGEVTGGIHGANRLGGNAVADITIFGKIAADNALMYINK